MSFIQFNCFIAADREISKELMAADKEIGRGNGIENSDK
jgi:hypothetical protein